MAARRQEAQKTPIDTTEEDETPLLDAVLEDVTAEELAGMEGYLDDAKKRPLGPNVACNGFLKKWNGAELIGRVINTITRPSQMNQDNEDEILFVKGIANYPTDALTKTLKVHTKKGRYHGVFGFQLDAGTMALSGSGQGTRIHLRVKEMIDLSGGRTRWTYDFVRMA
jgi:hypothetical protein